MSEILRITVLNSLNMLTKSIVNSITKKIVHCLYVVHAVHCYGSSGFYFWMQAYLHAKHLICCQFSNHICWTACCVFSSANAQNGASNRNLHSAAAWITDVIISSSLISHHYNCLLHCELTECLIGCTHSHASYFQFVLKGFRWRHFLNRTDNRLNPKYICIPCKYTKISVRISLVPLICSAIGTVAVRCTVQWLGDNWYLLFFSDFLYLVRF